jgi:hypothetical protein
MIVKILCFLIAAFVLAGVLFLVLILASRFRHIRRAAKAEEYLPYINEVLSSLLFEERPLAEVLESLEYKRLSTLKGFNLLLLRSVVQLHATYAGVYAARLEALYTAAGLHHWSEAKIASRSWKKKCKGIREVSEMQYTPAYTHIYKYTDSRNAILRLEALSGLVRLKGFEGLILLRHYTLPINDWIQINMLHALKNTREAQQADIDYLLQSPNESLQLLGLRIVEKFNLGHYLDTVAQMDGAGLSPDVQRQVSATRKKLLFL